MKPAANRSFPATRSLRTAPPLVVLEAFLASAVDSDNTRKAYRRNISAALASMRCRSLRGLTGLTLARFRAELVTDGHSSAAHAQVLASLRSFLRWSAVLGAHRLRMEVVEAALKIPRVTVRRPYQTLSPAEANALIRAAGSPRDRAIIGVLLGTGLRASEVAGLHIGDLVSTQAGPALYVRNGKGRRNRSVPVSRSVERAVRRYMAQTAMLRQQSGPLFLADDNGTATRGQHRLSPRSIAIMLAKVAHRAGIAGKSVSPHALRRSYATRSLGQTGDVFVVSRLLGHTSIATTQRYCDPPRPQA